MAGRTQPRSGPTAEQRKRRMQQVVFSVMAIIIILSMILTLVIQ